MIKDEHIMRAIYPSDITREQFEIIRPILAKKRTRPPTYELYDIFCAVLYLLKEGCTWRAIPHDFPKKDETGVSDIDRALLALVELERDGENRDPQTTMLIVDSKSIQNADTGGEKGYDAGKKKRN